MSAVNLVAGFRALLVASIVAAGCASTPQAPRDLDAAAKEFRTHPNSGTLYVYRSEHDRLEDDVVLYMDGRIIGQILPGTLFRIDTVPGRHVLHGIDADTGKIVVDARPGQLYFVELHVIEGRSHFRLVPEPVGRQRIATCCVLYETWAPGQRPLLR